MEISAQARRHYAWRLYDFAGSRTFRRRWAQLVDALQRKGAVEWLPLLGAILLIEMRERGSLWRTTEWSASFALRFVGGKRRFTRGPLQLSNAPWNFDAAVSEALALLVRSGCATDTSRGNLRRVAEAWNGPVGSNDRSFNYQDALEASISAVAARHFLT